MVVPLVLAAMSLCMIAPVSTAPLAASTTIVIPDVVTMTVGFLAPTEIPDMKMPDLSGSGSKNALSENKSPGSLFHFPGILARQIRIDDYDATGNMSWPSLGGPTLLKRSKKKDAEDRARLQSLQDNAAAPSATPQGLNFGSPTKASSSAMEELGESRMDVSDTFHSLLGTAFSGANAQNNDQNTSSTTHYTYKAKEPAMPAGPGYTTDTMAVPAPKAARRDVQRETFSRISVTHGKRHSMMFDLNALLPEPPSTTDTTAAAGPTPAWQNMGFVNIDSNRAPPPLPVPQNVTGAAEDVSQAPGDIAQAPETVTSAA